MAKSYKVIDGVLYQEVDTTEIKERLETVVESVTPYKTGIEQCREQIKKYEEQISTIIANSGLEKEVVRAIDPEKASFLGW